jgi:alpha 1,3-glucosidase
LHRVGSKQSGVFDAFLFVGPSPKDVVAQYCAVTGTSAIPQLFSTAYHQCRWNYKDEADVAGVDAGFDEHDIPYDTIWLDIEHTDGKKYFTWDKNLFPNPKEMQNKIGAKGRHMVTIVDPHVKRDDDFPLHKEASSHGYYVKDVNGKDFDGWCWPGASSYLDMLSPEVRSWWATKFSYSNYVGSTPILYIWNDMNEPSVFNGPEVFTFFTILAPFLLAFEQCSGRGWYFVYLDRGFFNSVVFASISTY